MNSKYKRLQLLVWSGLALVVVFVVSGYLRNELPRTSDLPVISEVKDFVLTNQLGQKIGMNDLLGKVWVADIIFSRCGGPCPKMTQQMSKLQNSFSPELPLRFVTLTTDPDYDTPKVLQSWSLKFQADPNRWLFLTGPKSQIKGVAIDGLKLTALDKTANEQETPVDLFIHSTVFMLVDKHGRVRGHTYESLEPEFEQQISRDIRKLLRER